MLLDSSESTEDTETQDNKGELDLTGIDDEEIDKVIHLSAIIFRNGYCCILKQYNFPCTITMLNEILRVILPDIT